MSQDFEFVITISADGETVTGEVKGLKGHKCEDVQHVLDQIGNEIEHHHTAEWDEKEPIRLAGTTSNTLKLGGW